MEFSNTPILFYMVKEKLTTTITISVENYIKLAKLRLDLKKKTFNDVVSSIMDLISKLKLKGELK